MIPSSCKRTKHSFTALDSFWRSVRGKKSQRHGGARRRIRERERKEREGREKGGGREGEERGNSHRVHRKACSVPIKAAATLAQLVVDPVPFAVRVRECEGVMVECEGMRCGCVR